MNNTLVHGKKSIFKYSLFSIIMLLACYAKTSGGIAPFGLGLLVGLIYSNQNILAITPFYVAGVLLASPTLNTLAIALAPPVILGAAHLLHKLVHRPVKMWQINIYALVSQIPALIIGTINVQGLVSAIANLVLSQIFTYTTTSFVYAALIRGIKHRFRLDEIASGLVLLMGVSMGLFRISILGFRPYYTIVAILLMLIATIGSPLSVTLAALAVGGGAGIFYGNLTTVGALVSIVLITSIFIKHNYYMGICVYGMCEIFCGLAFNAFGGYDYLHAIALAIAMIIMLLVPKSARAKLSNIYNGYATFSTSRAYAERIRSHIHSKLMYVSKVLNEMSDYLLDMEGVAIVKTASVNKIASEISTTFCGRCPNLTSCMKALGGETSIVIEPLVTIADNQGEATADNLNAFLSGRCNRIVGLLSSVNSTVARHKLRQSHNQDLSSGRQLLGDQTLGLARMLDNMAQEINKPTAFDDDKEKQIIDELACLDILCTDIIVESIGCGYCLTLLIRKQDCDKEQLLTCIDKIMGFQVEIKGYKPSKIDGFVYLTLADMPRYGICYAAANHAHVGKTSGDSYSLNHFDDSKVMIALLDGMGTGAEAHYNSSCALSMIESFYKAGIDNATILSFVNKLLAAYSRENFSCLDMSVVDLNSGICDFIKLGAPPTVIVRGKESIRIDGGALPLGIVEEAEPASERKVLLNGDLIIITSDGITDSIGTEGVELIATRLAQENPQVIADFILDQAIKMNDLDDMTVLVGKIFLKQLKKNLANIA